MLKVRWKQGGQSRSVAYRCWTATGSINSDPDKLAAALGFQEALALERAGDSIGDCRRFFRFMAIPMIPAPPIGRYTRGLRMPAPGHPVSATRSPIWLAEHGAELQGTSMAADHQLAPVAA